MLYPFLFIVLPILAFLMILILIICNLIGHLKMKRKQQIYNDNYEDVVKEKEINGNEMSDGQIKSNNNWFNGFELNDNNYYDWNYNGINYNEYDSTYKTLNGADGFGLGSGEKGESLPPIRPISGWAKPII